MLRMGYMQIGGQSCRRMASCARGGEAGEEVEYFLEEVAG